MRAMDVQVRVRCYADLKKALEKYAGRRSAAWAARKLLRQVLIEKGYLQKGY